MASSSPERCAAVNNKVLHRDVAGLIREQKYDSIRDVLHLGIFAKRSADTKGLEIAFKQEVAKIHGFHHVADHIGFSGPGIDAVAADSVRPKLKRSHPHQMARRCLGRAVRSLLHARDACRIGRNRHDRPFATGAHALRNRPGDKKHALDVYGEDGVELCFWHVNQVSEILNARDIDEEVDPTKACLRFGHEALDGIAVRHIDGARKTLCLCFQALACGGECVRIAIYQGQPDIGLSKHLRRSLANAAPGAGDQCDAALKSSQLHGNLVSAIIQGKMTTESGYSITSSARARVIGDSSIPNALATRRLILRSSLVGRSKGNSPASTFPAAFRNSRRILRPSTYPSSRSCPRVWSACDARAISGL